jgi:hypothetical protein
MTPQIPNQVRLEMAKRDQRIHHYLFHEVRNNWLFYDDNTKNEIRDLGWEPPRPALEFDPIRNRRVPILDNFSGEDFLFMHREMIGFVNELLQDIQDPEYPKIEGWNPIPRPGDLNYPVPSPWTIPNDPDFNNFIINVKSDQYFENNFIRWERQFKDHTYLSQISLGRLGAEMEFSVHNMMHMRWASQPKEERPDSDPTQPDSIDVRWDDISYDYLGDTYSSHVNNLFWKLHGWIDDRIEDWKLANGITGDIHWTGTWVGHMHGHHTARLLNRGLSTREEKQATNLLKVLKVTQGKRKVHPFLSVNPIFN